MAGKKWTDVDREFLQRAIQDGIPYKQIAILLDRTVRSIRHQGSKLPKPEYTAGYTNNRLTVLNTYVVYEHGQHKTRAKCRCSCGNITTQKLTDVKSGRIKSCGCWKNEQARARTIKRNYKHGKSNNGLYGRWAAMKTRCTNPNSKFYHLYGGRGISVCDDWTISFVSFETWAMTSGYDGILTLDRIDVNGNYCPQNCRWVDRKVQAQNKRNVMRVNSVQITAFGETKNMPDWLKDSRCNVNSKTTLCYRLGAGWSPEDAISQPSERQS